MYAIQTLLVHVDAQPASAERLRLAQQLASQFEARITALYAVRSALMQYPSATAFSADAAGLMQACDEERRAAARALVEATPGRSAGLPMPAWASTQGEPTRAFARQALAADLLVLGQHRAEGDDGAVPADFVASVLQGSGRPALVLPYIGAPAPLDGTALVAWKESRESARALSAALPLLRRSRRVLVASWGEAGRDGSSSDAPVDVLGWLRGHGVVAELHPQHRAGADVGDELLSLAADCSAALLVMGCYGHGRAREWVLGGATRTVLQSMTLPVLMAH
jgi:nucleotide-binding universal stress UspA family protein